MYSSLHIAIYEALKDPSLPENRILRKVAVLTLCAVIWLIVYRYIALEFDSFKSIIGTAMQVFLIYVAGIIGGLGVAYFYRNFLKSVGATETKPSFYTFIVEWFIAFCAPIPPALLAGALLNAASYI